MNRTNLFAVLGILAVLVAGGVTAIVVNANRDSDTATQQQQTTTANADTRAAAERDAAIKAGTEIAATLTTLDYKTVDQDLDRWESLATGDLLTQLKSNRTQSAQAVTDAQTTSKGTVLSAALAELDRDKGTARMLAAVSVDVTAGGEPSTKRQRLSVTLTRTPNGWKASAIDTV
jgi:Mce-associated membrane protein